MFDACEHRIRQLALRAGAEIRKAKRLPVEDNITTLYNETAPLLGLPVSMVSSFDADHFPAPHEMKTPDGKSFIVPRKECPKCHAKDTMVSSYICGSCPDGKEGFMSKWECISPECKFKELSKTPWLKVLHELGVELPEGMKEWDK